MDPVKIVRWVFGVVGVALLVGALIAVQNTRSFLADSVSASGTVVDLVPRSSTDSNGHSSTTFAPAVRFTTADGEDVTFFSATSSYPPAYSVGESVEVLYAAHDPQQARLHDWFSLWGVAAILGGLGTVFAAVSGGLTAAALRSRRTRPHPLGRAVAPDDEPDEPDVEPGVEPGVEPTATSGHAATAADPGHPSGHDPGLLGRGVKVQADVQHVKPMGTFAANGSENYRIVAQWLDPDRHEVRVFTSEDLPYDPTPYLAGRVVDVYLAPDDPARHYVDVSFLPRPAR